jgi:hypothetical protein
MRISAITSLTLAATASLTISVGSARGQDATRRPYARLSFYVNSAQREFENGVERHDIERPRR